MLKLTGMSCVSVAIYSYALEHCQNSALFRYCKSQFEMKIIQHISIYKPGWKCPTILWSLKII